MTTTIPNYSSMSLLTARFAYHWHVEGMRGGCIAWAMTMATMPGSTISRLSQRPRPRSSTTRSSEEGSS